MTIQCSVYAWVNYTSIDWISMFSDNRRATMLASLTEVVSSHQLWLKIDWLKSISVQWCSAKTFILQKCLSRKKSPSRTLTWLLQNRPNWIKLISPWFLWITRFHLSVEIFCAHFSHFHWDVLRNSCLNATILYIYCKWRVENRTDSRRWRSFRKWTPLNNRQNSNSW